ncbi:hypothetical protein [Streptomyces reniochalinae]
MLTARTRGPIALDTETTGLDVFGASYRLRTVQFGDEREAWVIHWERGGAFRTSALWALEVIERFRIHNAPFDWLVLDRHAGVSLESLAPGPWTRSYLPGSWTPGSRKRAALGPALSRSARTTWTPRPRTLRGTLRRSSGPLASLRPPGGPESIWTTQRTTCTRDLT